MNILHIDVEVPPGRAFDDVCTEAIRLAKLLDVGIGFSFNGVLLTASKDSTLEILEDDFEAASDRL